MVVDDVEVVVLEPEPVLEDLPGRTGDVVVVVVVDEPDDGVPSSCWACVICWAMAWMSDWKAARLSAFKAAIALV